MASLTLVHGLGVIVITGILTTIAPEKLSIWANSLGVMAAMLAAVQYIPQIWTTYHLKHVGSLSIPMMCIQTPGGFVFAASLFARLGLAGWSSWGIFVLTATMQGILLYMAIHYEIQNRNNAAKHDHLHTVVDRPESDTAAEDSPLLRPSGNGSAQRNYDTNQG